MLTFKSIRLRRSVRVIEQSNQIDLYDQSNVLRKLSLKYISKSYRRKINYSLINPDFIEILTHNSTKDSTIPMTY